MGTITILIIVMSCMVEICVANFCYGIYLEKKNFFERRDIFYASNFLFGFVLSFCEFIDVQKSELILSPILFLLIEQIIYKGEYQRKVISILLALLSIKGTEFLFIILLQAILMLDGNNDTIFWIYVLSGKMFSWLILIVVKERIHRVHNKHTDEKWLYMLMPMGCITAMFTMVYIWLKEPEETTVNGKVLIAFFVMFIGNIAIFEFYSMYSKKMLRNMESKFAENENQLNKKYYDKIADVDDKRVQLIHDLKHYMTAIQALIKTGEKSAAIALLEKIECELSENELRKYTNVAFLDSVLSEKFEYGKGKDVNLAIYVEPGVSFEKINKTEYIVMLSNLTDNAIEAAEFCDTREVSINIFTEKEGRFLVTKIQNVFKLDKIKIKRGELLTTKESSEFHGIGLKSVKAMVEKSNGIFLTDMNEDQFIAILILPT